MFTSGASSSEDRLPFCVELGASRLVRDFGPPCQRSRLSNLCIAPLRDVVGGGLAVALQQQDGEEIVRIAVVTGPTQHARLCSPACMRLRYSPHSRTRVLP